MGLYFIHALQTSDICLKSIVERVSVLENLVPKVQLELKEEMASHFKDVMVRLGEMAESILSGSRGSSVPLPVSGLGSSDTSPTKPTFIPSSDIEQLEEENTDCPVSDVVVPAQHALKVEHPKECGLQEHGEEPGEDKGMIQNIICKALISWPASNQ